MDKLLQDIKYELQRQAFGAPVDKAAVVRLIERINEVAVPEALTPCRSCTDPQQCAVNKHCAYAKGEPKA